MICGSKDEAIIGKVNNVIMPFLINRIRVEIALYYMKYVLKSDLARSKKWGAGGKPVAVG